MSDKPSICAFCGIPTEYILVDCEDGSSATFCSWECATKFLCSRVTEPIEFPESNISNNHCTVCGEATGDEEFCDNCLDIAFVLLTAIMKAKTIDDIAVSWITWRNGYPPKPESKQSMDNCRTCGKIMWIKAWERQKDRHGGHFCSRQCAKVYKT